MIWAVIFVLLGIQAFIVHQGPTIKADGVMSSLTWLLGWAFLWSPGLAAAWLAARAMELAP